MHSFHPFIKLYTDKRRQNIELQVFNINNHFTFIKALFLLIPLILYGKHIIVFKLKD